MLWTKLYLYRPVLRLICVLRSQVPPPLLRWQGGSEHTESSRNVWVNHSWQSPPLTDECSLHECGSYLVTKHYSEIGYYAGFEKKNIKVLLLSNLHSLDAKELCKYAS